MSSLDPDLRALQEVRDAVQRASRAQAQAALWTQEQTDKVCAAMAQAAAAAAHDLARLAVEETGIGRVHYKVLKNLFGSEGTWASIKDVQSVGVIKRDEAAGLVEVASPAGVVAGIIPTTNPTSTTINNALINIKARNAIVFSPHPRAKRCIGETVEVLRRAIERAGGPADLVCMLSNPTVDSTAALMSHKKIALILATGGSGLVRAAYSSGKPAFGVGPGNVPVYIDRSAEVAKAAKWIVASQSFDNATLCCSEQALVLDAPIAEQMLAELKKRGAHLCSAEETLKLERHCIQGGMMSAAVVGKDPSVIAEGAGFHVPSATTILLAHQAGVGREFPLSAEVLCPVLSIHVVDGWKAGCVMSLKILRHGGLGHTIGIWSRDEAVLDAWFIEKPASRMIVNGPTSQGAVGYSTGLTTAFSLGCGTLAGNITSDNISVRHMLNIKRAGFVSADWEERYVADLARAAEMTGELAPRGSGLAGDAGLSVGQSQSAQSRRPDISAPVGWTNPMDLTPGAAPMTPAAKPQVVATLEAKPAPAAAKQAQGAMANAPAPRFSGSGFAKPLSAPQRPASMPAPQAAPAPQSFGPYVGMSLTTQEIQGILSNAGSGCPLGPCAGCQHQDPTTGGCNA